MIVRMPVRVIGGVALAAIVFIAASAVAGHPRSDGPLQASGGYSVRVPLSPGEEFTWSLALPFNPTEDDIRIREVTLEAPSGLTIMGVLMTYGIRHQDGSCSSGGATDGFPPTVVRADGTTVEYPSGPVPGAIVPARGDRTCETHPSVSVGVRRDANTETGRIEGLRLRYEHRGADYEVLLQWSLTVERRQ